MDAETPCGPHVGARPRLLVAIYANPDYYPPTVNAVRMLSRTYQVRIVCRNMAPCFVKWPGAVVVERVGAYASAADKEAMPGAAKLTEFLRFVRAVRRAIAQSAPSAIYAYDPHALVAVLAMGGRRDRAVVLFHTHEFQEASGLPWASLGRFVTSAAMRLASKADYLIVPEARRAELAFSGTPSFKRVIIVPNFTSRRFFPPPDDWLELINSRFMLRKAVLAGTVGPSNGQLEATRALALVAPPARLSIIGPAPAGFAELLRTEVARLGLEERAIISGWLPHSDLPEYLRDSAAGLVLYKPLNVNLEHMSSATNKLFEYAAMGLPVVAPDLPGFREFFADDEWVVYADPADPRSIARAIEYILADRDRYIAMSLAARHAHETKYNYEHAFAPVLERIIAMTNGSGNIP